jgi:hypothetical protein
MFDTILGPHAHAVATRFLAAEHEKREPLVVAISGAHAYGFPSPDSDVDLKAVHIAPTRRIVGLKPVGAPIEHTEVTEGVELDYSSHEIGMVLAGILKGNGNFLERILGSLLIVRSPALEELRPLVADSLSRRAYRHYHGFATGQRKEADKTRGAKKVLYVLRTTLTGVHLLRTGQVETDLTVLAPIYGFEVGDLIEAKSRAELQTLDAAAWDRAIGRMDAAFQALDEALAHATVPEEPPNEDALEEWLIAQRLARC